MGSDVILPCLVLSMVFAGVIVISMLANYRQVQSARKWVATRGTVTKSRVRSHRDSSKQSDGYDAEPLVTYEYDVDGEHYRASRISFGEIKGEAVQPTLDKYPVGEPVQIYYDPADPHQAVLERDAPIAGRTLWLYVAGWLVLAAALPCGFAWSLDRMGAFLPEPDRAGPAVILFAMGVIPLLIGYANVKQAAAANNWNVAAGRILDTRVEAREKWDGSHHHTTLYNSEVVYAFEVNGRQYISDRVNFGARFSGRVLGGAPGFVKRALAKYPEGTSVQVYYNPRNPSECVLERQASGTWFLLVVGLAFLAGAVKMSGLIG
jgi:hypothetical protein